MCLRDRSGLLRMTEVLAKNSPTTSRSPGPVQSHDRGSKGRGPGQSGSPVRPDDWGGGRRGADGWPTLADPPVTFFVALGTALGSGVGSSGGLGSWPAALSRVPGGPSGASDPAKACGDLSAAGRRLPGASASSPLGADGILAGAKAKQSVRKPRPLLGCQWGERGALAGWPWEAPRRTQTGHFTHRRLPATSTSKGRADATASGGRETIKSPSGWSFPHSGGTTAPRGLGRAGVGLGWRSRSRALESDTPGPRRPLHLL